MKKVDSRCWIKCFASRSLSVLADQVYQHTEYFQRALRTDGYQNITSTMDPHAVCALHRDNHYDLILLDLQMPGMGGFQVMEELKKIKTDSYLPVLVITAQLGHTLRALQAGAKDFISKPFDLVEVKTRIHNMLEVRRLYKKLENYNEVLEQTVLERTAERYESEARFRRLTELSSDWYWEQDSGGHFTKIFGPGYEMLGLRVDDALGKTRGDHEMRWNEAERASLEVIWRPESRSWISSTAEPVPMARCNI